ncbi:MAG: response regulator transcription factor [Chloroflexi bacterium]|nr:response regulator transcription factor [Chloroflexota bacterium]
MIAGAAQTDKTTRSGPEVIRVLLVDDHEAMREGLRLMLSGDESIRVIGVARDEQKALDRVTKLQPDIVLLDLTAPNTDVAEVTRSIREAQPHAGMVILSDNPRHLAPAIKAGAVGFLTRSIGREELVAAIRLVYLWRLVLFNGDRGHCALVRL